MAAGMADGSLDIESIGGDQAIALHAAFKKLPPAARAGLVASLVPPEQQAAVGGLLEVADGLDDDAIKQVWVNKEAAMAEDADPAAQEAARKAIAKTIAYSELKRIAGAPAAPVAPTLPRAGGAAPGWF